MEPNSIGQQHFIHSIFQRANRFYCQQKSSRRGLYSAETLNIWQLANDTKECQYFLNMSLNNIDVCLDKQVLLWGKGGNLYPSNSRCMIFKARCRLHKMKYMQAYWLCIDKFSHLTT